MHRHRTLAAAVTLAALALAASASGATPARPATRPATRPPTAARAPRMVLPFIQDDWPKAVALAHARRLPLFVESWAPW